MCDDLTQRDVDRFLASRGVSRRDFGKVSAAAGLVMMLPPVANAQETTETDVEITTPDGVADCYFVHPSSGKHPAVLIWPDILGLRPAFRAMGKRLAESGYSVLVINQFYRDAKSPVVGEGASFSQPETRAIVMPMRANLSADTNVTDASACIDFLKKQTAVDTNRKMGTTGYCMGGPMVMRTVAVDADWLGAGATFHGGGMATNAEDSPHLLIPKTKAHMLHCVAENDDERNPEAKNILRAAYEEAGIPAEIEVYEGTLHGWCPPDSQVYNEAQAERAWSRMLALFERALV